MKLLIMPKGCKTQNILYTVVTGQSKILLNTMHYAALTILEANMSVNLCFHICWALGFSIKLNLNADKKH